MHVSGERAGPIWHARWSVLLWQRSEIVSVFLLRELIQACKHLCCLMPVVDGVDAGGRKDRSSSR